MPHQKGLHDFVRELLVIEFAALHAATLEINHQKMEMGHDLSSLLTKAHILFSIASKADHAYFYLVVLELQLKRRLEFWSKLLKCIPTTNS